MTRITEIPHSEITGRTLMLFTQTSRLMRKYIDTYFYKKARFSFTQFMVLKTLASNNGVMNQTQIADWTQTELHSVTTLVNRLKKNDLVNTKRSDIDKRVVNVFLTSKGRTMLDQAMPVAEEIIDHMMSPISISDTAKLTQILEIFRDNIYKTLESISKN